MSQKRVKKLRKLLRLKSQNLEPTQALTVGFKKVGVIDGVNNELRVEHRDKKQLFSDENKRLYRKLKKELSNKNSDIGSELKKDLGGLNE